VIVHTVLWMMWMIRISAWCVLGIAFAAVPANALTLHSPAFASGAMLPSRTVYDKAPCSGPNRSPQLRWDAVPSKTRSFALTVLDIDAPAPGGWWHWVRFDIPASARGLASAAAGPGTDGRTSWGESRYGGPCPPPGRPHRYVFTLYALDLPAIPGANAATIGPALLTALRGHVLAKATLVGRYGR
jgi:Raf kinase inhibitor-like YbhB/YbcL family protein